MFETGGSLQAGDLRHSQSGTWSQPQSCLSVPYLSPCYLQVQPESLELHYWSRRQPGTPPGLWVVGIIEAVAEEMYGHLVDVRMLRGREDGSCDHEVRCVWLCPT